MAWRFKVSKYKNAAPKFPKREESVTDVSTGTLMQSCGNHIAASCTYMAFNTDSGTGNLGILPLETTGRIGQSLSTLKCHTDNVTDMQFSPFHDELLATCSADCTVKVWSLSEPEHISQHLNSISPLVPLPGQEKRVENVAWNPVADNILGVTVYQSLKIFDVENGKELYDISSHGDQIQSMSWHGDGAMLVTSCKDKKLRTIDPRSSSIAQECQCFESNRDSRAVWIGSTDYIVTTGFTNSRDRVCRLWDSRNLSSSLVTESVGNSNCTLMPLLDEDTCMMLLIGKGDTGWTYLEVNTTDKKLTMNNQERMDKSEQIKGACLVPKRAVHVMEGEVDRLLILTSNSILPVPCIVPRKQYKEFHADLFPDTKCGEAALTSSQWIAGENGKVAMMSLDPDRRSKQTTAKVSTKDSQPKTAIESKKETEKKEQKEPVKTSTSQPSVNKSSASFPKKDLNPEPRVVEPREPSKASKAFGSLHQSKCKYLKGKTLHSSTHIVNIRKLDRTLPGQSNMFYANTKRCAIPIEGSGGLVSVLEFNKPGRLPDAGVPVIQNGSKVNDTAFDPFDENKIVIGCDNARVIMWRIPDGGITETMTDCESYLLGHTEKINFIRFHPLAKDVLLTCAYDMRIKLWNLDGNTEELEIRDHTDEQLLDRDVLLTCAYDMRIKLWNLDENTEELEIRDHEDEIFCAEWSPDGKLIATVCKDGKIRIFDPRKSDDAIKIGTGPEGVRGARVVWTNNMKYLLVSGFSKKSMRTVSIYSVADLGEPLHKIELDTVPAILVPHYDEGTSTVYLTGRGDNTIFTFEVSEEPPHLYPLASIVPEGAHQGIYLLPSTELDVRNIEIAKLWRLTKNSVEPISVTVPRKKLCFVPDGAHQRIYLLPSTELDVRDVEIAKLWRLTKNSVEPISVTVPKKKEYFQDDLFPEAVKYGTSALSSNEWFRGIDKPPVKVSLRPSDMKPLSEAPIEAPKASKYDSYNPDTYKTDDMKKEELINAVTNKLGMKEDPLPQDEAEGVDSDEWDDY